MTNDETHNQPNTKLHADIKSGHTVPIPDPTSLTTEALEKGFNFQRELFQSKLDTFRELFTQNEIEREKRMEFVIEKINDLKEKLDIRINAIDAQIKLSREHEVITEINTKQAIVDAIEVARELASNSTEKTSFLRELHNGKFASIELQLVERTLRYNESKADSEKYIQTALASRDTAISAALAAQKEAVAEQNRTSAQAISKSDASTDKQLDQLRDLIATGVTGLNDKIDDVKLRITGIESRAIGATTQQSTTQNNQVQWVGIIGAAFGIIFGIIGIVLAWNSNIESKNRDRIIIEDRANNSSGNQQ